MNEILEKYARAWIQERTKLLTESQKAFFKRIIEVRIGDKEKTLEELIELIDRDALDNIMMLIQRSIEKE